MLCVRRLTGRAACNLLFFAAPLHPAVPDVQGAHAAGCQLTSGTRCRRFTSPALNAHMARLFHAIAEAGGGADGETMRVNSGCSERRPLPRVRLSRYDLFHGHLFLSSLDKQPGILFHAMEYPALQAAAEAAVDGSADSAADAAADDGAHGPSFDIHLGSCQIGSDVAFDQTRMDLRNVLFYAGRLAVLDVGQSSPLHAPLLWPGTAPLRTVYEDAFGEALLDVNYLLHDGGQGTVDVGQAAAWELSNGGRSAGSSVGCIRRGQQRVFLSGP